MKTSLKTSSLGAELHINAIGHEHDLQSFIDHEFWPRFVPDIKLEVDSQESKPDLNLVIESKKGWLFNPITHSLVCPPDNIVHAICTASYMLDAKRQEAQLYTLHGNIIANDTSTIALVGPISGIGKTGLSSHAIEKGWKWLADEKFVMNNQGVYLNSIKGVLQDEKTKQSASDNKPVAASLGRRRIDAFVVPIVTDTPTTTVHTYSQEKAFWHFNEEMSRDVRMTPFALDGPEVPLPSFDSENLATKRRRVAAELSELLPYLFIMGDSDSILDYLSEPIR